MVTQLNLSSEINESKLSSKSNFDLNDVVDHNLICFTVRFPLSAFCFPLFPCWQRSFTCQFPKTCIIVCILCLLHVIASYNARNMCRQLCMLILIVISYIKKQMSIYWVTSVLIAVIVYIYNIKLKILTLLRFTNP